MKKILFTVFMMFPLLACAQVPKMYIKLFVGANTANLVYRVEDVDSDILYGGQIGGSFRVSKKKAFLETGLTFVVYGITLSPEEDADLDFEEPINVNMRSLELPIYIGYIPVKSPVFKWYLYGGLANRFSLKGRYEYQGEEGTFKPKEADLHFYNLGARFGTQVDIAMFNIDLNYTIGITNAFRGRVRTNIHAFQLNIGFIF